MKIILTLVTFFESILTYKENIIIKESAEIVGQNDTKSYRIGEEHY